MELVRNFTSLNKKDADIAGGKGASLGEMTQAGIPVPPGFVVLSNSFEQFIKETDLMQEIDAILTTVDHRAIHTVEAASEKIKELILSRDMPKDIEADIVKSFAALDTQYVAVRSSATAEDGKEHAWAGQLESYLNITKDGVLEKVKHCWASLFTPRAIFYRFEKGLHTTKISVAVVVQKMVNSELSGIAFSVHPVTEDYNQLIIEAGFGLGEAIVSGSVTPDSYVIEKEPRKIVDINVSTQERALYRIEGGGNEWRDIPESKASSQVLDESKILELSGIILNIEKHYGFPCDIEWAYEGGKFYIVQSRPITTLSPKTTKEVKPDLPKKDDYYLNFKAKLTGLFFTEISVKAYDPNEAITIVKDGSFFSFYSKKAEKENSDRAKQTDFFETVETGTKIVKDIAKKYKDFKLPTKLSLKEFSAVYDDLLKLISYYKYANNSYLDTFMTTGTADQIEKIGKCKNDMQECLFSVFFAETSIFKQLLQNILSEFSLVSADIEQYTHSEMVSLVTTGEKVSQNILEERKHIATVLKTSEGEIVFPDAKTSEKLLDILYGAADETDVLRGITGYSNGKIVKGKVKRIDTDYGDIEKVKRQMAEMEQGDILVSQITAPELMPAIKMAGAIVTDIGGLLSHAAIISRELKIPCVIGTKNASEILKDGDVVEVDAEKGIVRIIK